MNNLATTWARRLTYAAVVMCGAAAISAVAETLPPERQREVLQQALNAFDEGVTLARKDPVRSRDLFRRSAGAFQTLLDSGLRSAALEYNLGNACFRLDELGRAILHYRRAERIAPRNSDVQSNLSYARQRVTPLITAAGEQQIVERVLFWHFDTSIAFRYWFAVVPALAGWALLLAWRRWRERSFAVAALVCLGLGLANGASVAWELYDQQHSPHAVLVSAPQVLRLGGGEAYEPAMQQELGPGVELRVLSRRGLWTQVQLSNGLTGWLPSSAVEEV